MYRDTQHQSYGLRLTLSLIMGAMLSSGVLLIAPPPNAHAQDLAALVNQRCQAQYPAAGGYSAGVGYLAPPGDVYSWRCKQVSTSGGGAITDLPVNLDGIIRGS